MPTVKEKSDKNWPGLYDRFDELRKMEKVIRRAACCVLKYKKTCSSVLWLHT